MKIIRTRDDLFEIAARNAPTTACAKLIAKKGATILGGFTAAGGHSWIIQIKSPTGRVWLVQIIGNEVERRYQVRYPDEVPWIDWVGQHGEPWMIGDDPGECERLHLKAVLENDNANRTTEGNEDRRHPGVRGGTLRHED